MKKPRSTGWLEGSAYQPGDLVLVFDRGRLMGRGFRYVGEIGEVWALDLTYPIPACATNPGVKVMFPSGAHATYLAEDLVHIACRLPRQLALFPPGRVFPTTYQADGLDVWFRGETEQQQARGKLYQLRDEYVRRHVQKRQSAGALLAGRP